MLTSREVFLTSLPQFHDTKNHLKHLLPSISSRLRLFITLHTSTTKCLPPWANLVSKSTSRAISLSL
jgi:hypothetical protein